MLTLNFLNETLRLCFLKKTICTIVSEYLKYSYIPNDLIEYKKVLKSIVTYYQSTEKLPTFGVISQQHSGEPKVLEVISNIKSTDIVEEKVIIEQLQEYIKRTRFQILVKKCAELYNEGRVDEAISHNEKESAEISNFSLLNKSGKFSKLFGGAKDRFQQRSNKSHEEDIKEKIPFGIPDLDAITYGGMDKGETALFIGRSGAGKSTFLKSVGLYAAQLGYNVLHVQLEGGREECEKKYDQAWTSSTFLDITNHNFPKAKMQKIQKAVDDMLTRNRDLYIYSFEQFGEASAKDVRDLVLEYIKDRGCPPDLLIIDYLELLHPGDGLKYGVDTQSIKMKITNTSRKLKNICSEFGNLRVLTATQTGDIKPEKYNDPSFVITRSDSKGDKNLVDAFSYVITHNQTRDERKVKLARIFVDKLRNYDSEQVIRIRTGYEIGKYCKRGELIADEEVSSFKEARKKYKSNKKQEGE